jgi:predicted ATPase
MDEHMDKELLAIRDNLVRLSVSRANTPESESGSTWEPSPEEMERQRLVQMKARAEAAGVPIRFQAAKPEDIDPFTWSQYEEALADKEGLFLHGPAGTGKTHLAVAAMHALPRHRGERFVSVPELLMELRNTFRDGERVSEIDIIDRYASAPLLILDDLGAEKSTDFAIQALYIIIDRRYARMLPTIITSNLSVDEIAEKVGDRIASRIAGMCKVIEMQGKDRRIG